MLLITIFLVNNFSGLSTVYSIVSLLLCSFRGYSTDRLKRKNLRDKFSKLTRLWGKIIKINIIIVIINAQGTPPKTVIEEIIIIIIKVLSV